MQTWYRRRGKVTRKGEEANWSREHYACLRRARGRAPFSTLQLHTTTRPSYTAMGSAYTREQLEGIKRADLQKIGKVSALDCLFLS
jgi:hypothetical protein